MKHTTFLIATAVLMTAASHAQNVGIGTTEPGTRFTVRIAGTGAAMENSSTSSPVVIKTYLSNAFGQIGTTSQHPLELMAGDGTTQLRLMPNGNVGIGATPGLAKFVVRGNVGAVSAMFGDNSVGVAIENNSPGVGFNSYYNGSRKAIAPGFGGLVGMDATTGRFYVFTAPASVASPSASLPITERLTILPNGHVGIGINTPASILDVNGRIRIRQTTQTAGIGFDGDGASLDRGFVGMVNNDYIGFYGSGGAGWGMAMNVSTGNVGIGTITPASRLHVEGTGLYAMRVVNTGATDGALRADANNGNALLAANSSSITATVRLTNAGGGPALTTNGAIGIGLSATNSKLQVEGSVSMSYKAISENYTATDDDYSIRFTPTGVVNRVLTMPSAVGKKGRIYIISADIDYQINEPLFFTMLTILNQEGNNILTASNYKDSQGNVYDGLMHAYGRRKLSVTLQSTGTVWRIIGTDFN